MRKKPSKRNNERCFICKGSGRLRIRKTISYIRKEYIFVEERCQICEGKGEINYES